MAAPPMRLPAYTVRAFSMEIPMLVRSAPDLRQRLDRLGQRARYECAGPPHGSGPEPRQAGPVDHAAVRGGRTVPLLKVLLTDRCDGGCRYCAFRAARDVPRTTITPEEMARGFADHVRAGLVRGLFLSSGLAPDAVTAMDRLLATAELVRRGGFGGYVHLKLLPGAEEAQIERAVRLATRVSVNLEAPTREHLRRLAPGKCRPRLMRDQLDLLRRLARAGALPTDGWTTQYVVGPAGESDRELLATSQALYRSCGLRRAYYSRFEPVPGTPLEGEEPTGRRRQHRLYQADALLRRYGFTADELVTDADDRLPARHDPKRAWARAHPERFPVEVMTADRALLLRVPGLGPVAVERLLWARRQGRIDDLAKLRQLGIATGPLRGFLTLDGHATGGAPRQLSLFGGGDAAAPAGAAAETTDSRITAAAGAGRRCPGSAGAARR